MRHGKAHRKLGRPGAHRQALLRNLAAALVRVGRIETTLPKAREVRRLAERLITLGKAGTLAARRQAARLVHDPEAVSRVFATLADRYRDRAGGYTRILRLGERRGDAAPMAIIEYLSAEAPAAPAAPAGARRRGVKTAKAAKTAAA